MRMETAFSNFPTIFSFYFLASPFCVFLSVSIHLAEVGEWLGEEKGHWGYYNGNTIFFFLLKVFSILEEAKVLFNLEDYSVSQITLEQVFLTIANIDKAENIQEIKVLWDSVPASDYCVLSRLLPAIRYTEGLLPLHLYLSVCVYICIHKLNPQRRKFVIFGD